MRLKQHLIAIGEWSVEQHQEMDLALAEEVKAATKEAEKNGILGHGLHHPFHTMFEDVFEELPCATSCGSSGPPSHRRPAG